MSIRADLEISEMSHVNDTMCNEYQKQYYVLSNEALMNEYKALQQVVSSLHDQLQSGTN